ncbi:L-lactate permease [Pendulispora albinea]|uniref:L-lactate permease n=1 Tax=Pendulispora albinea TaxID=2741071 RepID=A0ABZ2M7Y5_9BACT
MFVQPLTPVADSLALSALIALLPLVLLFILLGGIRVAAHRAALVALGLALVVAIAFFHMPAAQALSSAAQGVVFGLFPILWIVINALWIYHMTVHTGHFDVLRRSFSRISDDPRIQGVIVAFCFGGLIEALAGFGAPVAISSIMLVALGFPPVRAAVVALVANTAPVAFGAMGVPVITLAKVTALPLAPLSATVGRQTPLLAVVVPLVLVALIDGKRGVRETWFPALLSGIAFAVGQFFTSNYLSTELTDIVASLAGALVLIALPRKKIDPAIRSEVLSGASDDSMGDTSRDDDEVDATADVVRAYAPYAVIILVFALAQLPALKAVLSQGTVSFPWPLLDVITASGKRASGNVFSVPLIATGGTLVALSGIATAVILRIPAGKALAEWGSTVHKIRFPILTVTSVLALAYVMNLSGQTTTIGSWVAGTGRGLAFLSPVLGWFGVAVSGSDTSSNALFGALQATAAQQAGLSPVLLSAANSSGGVLGKMISPQNLTIACASAKMVGQEGALLRKVLPWSLGLLAIMCVIVVLQSTPVLGWMLP